MTAFAMIVPYRRTSPVHVPRRDLVLGAADSLLLEVSVIEYDNPAAMLLDISASGTGSPNLKMLVWPDRCDRYSWDYGMTWPNPAALLWSGVGMASQTTPGTFNVTFPTGTMQCWPRRSRYALQLDWNDGASNTELLTQGYLHLMRSVSVPGDSGVGIGSGGGGGITPPPGTVEVMATDAEVPVLTDTQQYIFID